MGHALHLDIFVQVEGDIVIGGILADGNIAVGIVQIHCRPVAHGRAVGTLRGQGKAAFFRRFICDRFQLVLRCRLTANDVIRVPGFIGKPSHCSRVTINSNRITAICRAHGNSIFKP